MSCADSAIEQNGRQAAVLADRVQLLAAPGQDLVRVGLVAHVPEDLVPGRLQHRVQRHGQLARAEVRAEVAADLPDGVDDVLAHLLGELQELRLGEALEVAGPSMSSSRVMGCACR